MTATGEELVTLSQIKTLMESENSYKVGNWTIYPLIGNLAVIHEFAEQENVQADQTRRSVYYYSYERSFPSGLVKEVVDLHVRVVTGDGLWWSTPYHITPEGFSYYVMSSKSVGPDSRKDLSFTAIVVLN